MGARGGGLGARCAVAPPATADRASGMMMRSPTLTIVSGGILLALASTSTGLP